MQLLFALLFLEVERLQIGILSDGAGDVGVPYIAIRVFHLAGQSVGRVTLVLGEAFVEDYISLVRVLFSVHVADSLGGELAEGKVGFGR